MSRSGLYVGQLEKAMYGTRDAPAVWQEELENTLRQLGFSTCISTPCLYYNAELDIRIVAHVDDLMITGEKSKLLEFEKKLRDIYEIKSSILGPGPDEVHKKGSF